MVFDDERRRGGDGSRDEDRQFLVVWHRDSDIHVQSHIPRHALATATASDRGECTAECARQLDIRHLCSEFGVSARRRSVALRVYSQ